jgi:serine/threonine protein kinase
MPETTRWKIEKRINRLATRLAATPVRKLGEGGMGEVYLLRRDDTGEHLALKVMVPEREADPAARALFLRESENCLALRHPNVVRAYEAGFAEELFFLTMEFCDGGSLDKTVERRGALSPADAVAIILDVLAGLQYAHGAEIPHVALADGSTARGAGLVHRDLKPQNIFVRATAAGRPAKVGDFGLSKAFELAGLSGQTRPYDVGGTPAFMPRRQILDYLYAKPEVDVWAAAASLYFLLSGFVPRDFTLGRDPWQTVMETQPVPILERGVSVPRRLAEVVDRALVDWPEIEFKEAAQLRAALESSRE